MKALMRSKEVMESLGIGKRVYYELVKGGYLRRSKINQAPAHPYYVRDEVEELKESIKKGEVVCCG